MDDELQNIEDVFVANGYDRAKVRRYMHEKKKSETEEAEEYRGVVSIPYLKGLSEKFKRITEEHGIRTTFRPGRKLKQLKVRVQHPLGNKRKAVVYKIPCGCERAVYI